jgi:hypothetical protein
LSPETGPPKTLTNASLLKVRVPWCEGEFMELTNDSPVGRLLEELSWEGNARRYREGGRGRENVLTTEVFAALDHLPRTHFLGAVLHAAHGADELRAGVAADAEALAFSVLPGDVRAVGAGGTPSSWTVQPDVVLESPTRTVWVEAKRIRRSSFQEHQIARTLHALTSSTAPRNALLLLVLAAPPPIPVKGIGPLDIDAAIRRSLDHVVEPAGRDALLQAAFSIAWITWDEVEAAVAAAARAYTNPDPSTEAAVQRMAAEVARAIAWHR